MDLRPYQHDMIARIRAAYAGGARNVLAVLPTGGGKTVVFAKLVSEHDGAATLIAHRHELVTQISVALCRERVRHSIVGPISMIRATLEAHHIEGLDSTYDPRANVAVASVDTLIRRQRINEGASLWVQDEAHHVLRGNKWGKAAARYPHAIGLGVTATPGRADGRGLGRRADGVFDVLLVGENARTLIDDGFLTDYRIFAPRTRDLRLEAVPVANDGDFQRAKLKLAVRRSRIVGDIVEHYTKIARGLLGVTFVTDVETGADVAGAYSSAGVPAECVTYKTSDRDRASILAKFKRREILQLVNVDLFGEGFDLPAIEVVSFARPTQSFPVYAQQFGRSLRILEGKSHAIIIDHVGNVLRHGLPDAPRTWSLDDRERSAKGKTITTLKVCPECTAVFARERIECPYCGFVPALTRRRGPQRRGARSRVSSATSKNTARRRSPRRTFGG